MIGLQNHIEPVSIVRATSYPNYIAFDEPKPGKASIYLKGIDSLNFDAFLSQDVSQTPYVKYQAMMRLMITKLLGSGPTDDIYIEKLRSFKPSETSLRRQYMYKLIAEAWQSCQTLGTRRLFSTTTAALWSLGSKSSIRTTKSCSSRLIVDRTAGIDGGVLMGISTGRRILSRLSTLPLELLVASQVPYMTSLRGGPDFIKGRRVGPKRRYLR